MVIQIWTRKSIFKLWWMFMTNSLGSSFTTCANFLFKKFVWLWDPSDLCFKFKERWWSSVRGDTLSEWMPIHPFKLQHFAALLLSSYTPASRSPAGAGTTGPLQQVIKMYRLWWQIKFEWTIHFALGLIFCANCIYGFKAFWHILIMESIQHVYKTINFMS